MAFSYSEVHKIAILDMRIVNTDRHDANILVQKILHKCAPEESAARGEEEKTGRVEYRLIPIDHGMCLPDSLELCEYSYYYL